MASIDFVQNGRALLARGEYQEAVKVCRLGLLAYPTEIDGRLVLGTALVALRRYDEALAEMRVALEISPSNPWALALKGESLLRKGDAFHAAQVLGQALAYAPQDNYIASLCREADSVLRSEDPQGFSRNTAEPTYSVTGSYPAHRGLANQYGSTDNSANITKPGSGTQATHLPPDDLSVGDMSGTVKVDASAIARSAMDDDMFDPPAEPPMASRSDDLSWRGDRLDNNSREVTGDLLHAPYSEADDAQTITRAMAPTPARGSAMGVGQGAYQRPMAPQLPSAPAAAPARPMSEVSLDDTTDNYPKRRDDDLDDEDTQARTMPPAPQRLPLERAPSSYIIPGKKITADLPVIREAVQPPPSAPPESFRPPEPPEPPYRNEASPYLSPSAPIPPPAPPIPPPAPNPVDAILRDLVPSSGAPKLISESVARQTSLPSQSTDMRVIRVGLGMNPEQTAEYDPSAPQQAGPPEVLSQQALPQQPPGTPGGSAAPGFYPQRESAAPKRRTSNPQAVPKPARKRSGWLLGLYILIGVAIVGGGVFAGLKIREVRLLRQIRASERDALSEANRDTYEGYLRARDVYQRILKAQATEATRAALARMQAALALEHGEGFEQADTLLAEIQNAELADAAVARAYLAIASGDREAAKASAEEVIARFSDEPMGLYLRGRAALLGQDVKAAVAALTQALERVERPVIYVALGDAYLAKGAPEEAKAAFERALSAVPGHPAAVIGRAKVQGAGNTAADELSVLEAIAAGKGQVASARLHRSQAALALAFLRLKAGERDRAAAALAVAAETRPDADGRLHDRTFVAGYVPLLLAVGDLAAAAKEAEGAQARWQGEPTASLFRAQVALAQEDPETALSVLAGDASAARPGGVDALLLRGRAHLAVGKPSSIDEAAKDIGVALEAAPQRHDVQIAMALVELARGNAEAAAARMKSLYEADKDKDRGELAPLYARALRAAGKLDDARVVIDEALRLDTTSGEAYLELARLDRASGNLAKARVAYAQAAKNLPGNAAARLEEALFSLDNGRIRDARQALDRLAQAMPSSMPVLVATARVQILTGALEEAEKTLSQAEALLDKPADEPSGEILRERGRLALKQQKPNEARDLLVRAHELRPGDMDTAMLLADVLFLEGDLEAAGQVLGTSARAAGKSDPDRLIALGRRDLELGNYPAATKAFDQAIDLMAKTRAMPRQVARVHYWRARLSLNQSLLDQARQELVRALELDPGNAEAQVALGVVAREGGEAEVAVERFEAAVELDPAGNPDVWYWLGELYGEMGRTDAAKTAFGEYVKRWPSGPLVEDARKALETLR